MKFYKYETDGAIYLYKITPNSLLVKNPNEDDEWNTRSVFRIVKGYIFSDSINYDPKKLILLKDDDSLVLAELLKEL